MELKNVTFGYSDENVIDGVSLKIQKNAITTIIGANGCGKTTLLRLMTRSLKPDSGTITLDGEDIFKISARSFAKSAAIVQQKNTAPPDLDVESLVAYGRIPHSSAFSYSGIHDEKTRWAMEATGLLDIRHRPLGTLSGGQRQRAFIAMALAQDTKLLFLDEPTTFLDIRYQTDILRLVKRLNSELGITVVMVLHDINQSIAYSDELIALTHGHVYAQGAPQEVITEQAVEDIYSTKLSVEIVKGMKTVLAV